jgi:thioredoxin-dependent peroxiredoxin
MMEAGAAAPDVELATATGETLTLSSLRGKPVVLYFYPKDDTSGCTLEALDFTKAKPDFDALGIPVIGISPDSVKSHQKFVKKHDLDLTLLSDEDKGTAQAYGVWVEKQMYGRTYMGVDRSTFLIDAKGKIVRVWNKVKVPGHVAQVLEAARELVS